MRHRSTLINDQTPSSNIQGEQKIPKGPYYFIEERDDEYNETTFVIYEKVFDREKRQSIPYELCYTTKRINATKITMALNFGNLLARIARNFLHPGQNTRSSFYSNRNQEEEEDSIEEQNTP